MAYDQRVADLEYELDTLRQINSELHEGNEALNQLVLDAQHERDEARAELAKTISNFEEFAEAAAEERQRLTTCLEEAYAAAAVLATRQRVVYRLTEKAAAALGGRPP